MGQAVKVGVYAPAALVEPFVPAEAAEKAKALEADAAALELDALLSYAEARSPAIQTAKAKVGLADAEIAGAEIWLPANPQISFGGGARTVAGASGFEFEVAVQQRLWEMLEFGRRAHYNSHEPRPTYKSIYIYPGLL